MRACIVHAYNICPPSSTCLLDVPPEFSFLDVPPEFSWKTCVKAYRIPPPYPPEALQEYFPRLASLSLLGIPSSKHLQKSPRTTFLRTPPEASSDYLPQIPSRNILGKPVSSDNLPQNTSKHLQKPPRTTFLRTPPEASSVCLLMSPRKTCMKASTKSNF